MIDFGKITTTSKLSETQFYSVLNKSNSALTLVNDSGEQITVDKSYAEQCLLASDQSGEDKKITMTELANIFLSNPGVVLTVNYNKQIDKDTVKKEIAALYPNKGGKILPEAEYTKRVNELLATVLKGEERTAVGRHSGSQDEFGRVHFIDMEKVKDPAKTYDTRQILVDPRTINWLILRGVKYIKK